MDFAVAANHRVILKENEKKYKHIDLARELKKLWNIKVTFIPIVIGALCAVTEELIRKLEDLEAGGRVRPEYREKSERLEEICCHSNFSEGPWVNADVKTLQEIIIIIIIISIILMKNPKTSRKAQAHWANYHERNTRTDITWWERWSIGNCARDYPDKWHLHKSEFVLEVKRKKITATLIYMQISQAGLEVQTKI